MSSFVRVPNHSFTAGTDKSSFTKGGILINLIDKLKNKQKKKCKFTDLMAYDFIFSKQQPQSDFLIHNYPRHPFEITQSKKSSYYVPYLFIE